MVRIWLAIVMVVAGWSTSEAQQIPYAGSQSFAAYRDGQRIGTHRLDFQKEGDQLVVSTSIDLAVKVVGLTAYRYSHRSREVWRGSDLWAVDSSTDDDGKHYSVRAVRDGPSLMLDRKAPAASEPFRESVAPGIMPSSHWNMRQTQQAQLLNSQKGTVDPIQVTPLGRETVRTASGSVEAMRYRYTGGVRMDQWFDGHGRWVKTTFTAPDGSLIDYVLQE